ncbi:MAG: glutamate racemase [Oligoflexia bacterium]|nr:glutamate racemase [Oligoflexia bacterium]MBF0366524.1 glutamate racemase [Oligoflexia bacterium]
MDQNCKIGIFDSGFGGLTIFKHIKELLPEYDYVYLGDSARTPYGHRSFEAVLKFTMEGVDFLFEQGCRLIIVACNTASARALRSIQQQWLTTKYQDYPFLRVLGVIRPTVESLGGLGQSKTALLWATMGTVKSDSFLLEASHHAPDIHLIQLACPLLVPLIEAGELSGDGVAYFVKKYWQESVSRERGELIDVLLLACTHYPLLLPEIRKVVPDRVKIVTQGEIVAGSLKDYLQRHPEMEKRLSRANRVQYYTTDRCDHFDHLAKIFMSDNDIISELAIIDRFAHN